MTEQEPLHFIEQPEIPGLSKELIFDLKDIVTKLGKASPRQQKVRFRSGDLGEGLELNISASTKPEDNGLIVTASSTTEKGLSRIRTNQGDIMWDNLLTAQDAEESVKRIDNIVRNFGLIDPKTGERKPIPPDIAIEKPGEFNYRVEDVFARPDTDMPALNDDPKELLEQFDYPERLAIFEMPIDGTTIILEENLPYFEKKERITLDLLREKGIDMADPRAFGKLPLEDRLNLRKEVEKRMEESEG